MEERRSKAALNPLSFWAYASTQLLYIIKTMSYNHTNLPLLLERAGVRRIKSSSYIPLIPTFSLWRRGSMTCIYTSLVRVIECHFTSMRLDISYAFNLAPAFNVR